MLVKANMVAVSAHDSRLRAGHFRPRMECARQQGWPLACSIARAWSPAPKQQPRMPQEAKSNAQDSRQH
jgi:hypothetical protein